MFQHPTGAIITDIEEVSLAEILEELKTQTIEWARMDGLTGWKSDFDQYAQWLVGENKKAWRIESAIGHYRYQDYSATLPDGGVLKLQDLGAKDAFLDISEDGTITLRMTMLTGNPVVHSAKVLEAYFAQGKGHWVAQWPDMKGRYGQTSR